MDTYTKEGIVIELKDTVVFNEYFSKREFKLRYTETDLTNKIVEQKVKFIAQDKETIDSLNMVRVDDHISVKYYISGKDVTKKDNPSVIMNFTTLVCFDVSILSSASRDTEKDRNAVITGQTREYKDPLIAVTDEQLAGILDRKKEGDGTELLEIWDKKKDKYGLQEPNSAEENMKSKILSKQEDNPFDNVEEVNGEKIMPLPF
jgi:hypothetical protein